MRVYTGLTRYMYYTITERQRELKYIKGDNDIPRTKVWLAQWLNRKIHRLCPSSANYWKTCCTLSITLNACLVKLWLRLYKRLRLLSVDKVWDQIWLEWVNGSSFIPSQRGSKFYYEVMSHKNNDVISRNSIKGVHEASLASLPWGHDRLAADAGTIDSCAVKWVLRSDMNLGWSSWRIHNKDLDEFDREGCCGILL